MPAKRKKERVVGTHFIWLIGQRKGVYYADGRSNSPHAGRHSLGTKNYQEALENLKKLDLTQAVEFGKADRALLKSFSSDLLSLAEGRRLYMEHVQRPRVVGGAKPATPERYDPVLDKFEEFAQTEGIDNWNHVTQRTLQAYAAFLDGEGYAYATEYLELTVLKQTVKQLVKDGHLPASCLIDLPLRKPEGVSTYCWRAEEVQAMIDHCRHRPELSWLGDVLTALACTGLRISELAALRWSDVNWKGNMITLTDESTHAKKRNARQTKSGHSRWFPIKNNLRKVLEALPRSRDGIIFHGPSGDQLKAGSVRRTLVDDVVQPLLQRYPSSEGELGFKDGRLHSFRHYFCSTCANQRVPEQMVMSWLGHSDSKMIRHYYHLHDEEAQRQMERVQFLEDDGDNRAAAKVS